MIYGFEQVPFPELAMSLKSELFKMVIMWLELDFNRTVSISMSCNLPDELVSLNLEYLEKLIRKLLLVKRGNYYCLTPRATILVRGGE